MIDYRNVTINNGFWKQKQELNDTVAIHAVYDRFQDTGRIDAFQFDWKEGMENQPHVYWDSDVFKWLEGACYIFQRTQDQELLTKIDRIIDQVEKNQQEDGYFNIYYTVCETGKRFTSREMHELYCAGHMFEAAVAYYEATGNQRFISISERYAECIKKIFMEEKSAGFVTPGHPEIELALVRLYRVTGNKMLLELAGFFLDMRANNDHDEYFFNEITRVQDNAPVREMEVAVGHVVRCLYLLSGAADYAHETGDAALLDACLRVYQDIVKQKMYITGGLGSTFMGETFTIPYDLPNETAYAETCAAISMMMFANRLGRYTKNATYANVVEWVMYNGMLSGISLDGKAFFYENPLEINIRNKEQVNFKNKSEHFPEYQRKEVFLCSCCPPNLNRVLSSMGNYIYDLEQDDCYINQFVDSTLHTEQVTVTQKTKYPLDGTVKIKAMGVERLHIRIPDWCTSFTIDTEYLEKNGYAIVENTGEEITVVFAMKPCLIESHNEIYHNVGKVAVTYGPLVYCVESVDNIENLETLYLTKDWNPICRFDEFFGAYCMEADGFMKESESTLYHPVSENFKPCKIRFIPYYGFANRGETNMRVWVHYRGKL